jgi:hypothetical protein
MKPRAAASTAGGGWAAATCARRSSLGSSRCHSRARGVRCCTLACAWRHWRSHWAGCGLQARRQAVWHPGPTLPAYRAPLMNQHSNIKALACSFSQALLFFPILLFPPLLRPREDVGRRRLACSAPVLPGPPRFVLIQQGSLTMVHSWTRAHPVCCGGTFCLLC